MVDTDYIFCLFTVFDIKHELDHYVQEYCTRVLLNKSEQCCPVTTIFCVVFQSTTKLLISVI